jgi:hypothetical protein
MTIIQFNDNNDNNVNSDNYNDDDKDNKKASLLCNHTVQR